MGDLGQPGHSDLDVLPVLADMDGEEAVHDAAERVVIVAVDPTRDVAGGPERAAETACNPAAREVGSVPREFGVLNMPEWVCPRIPYERVDAGGAQAGSVPVVGGVGSGPGSAEGAVHGVGSGGVTGGGTGGGSGGARGGDKGVGGVQQAGSSAALSGVRYTRMLEAMASFFRDPRWWVLGIAALHCMDSIPCAYRGAPLAGCTVPICAQLREHLEQQRARCPPLRLCEFRLTDVHGRAIDIDQPLLLLDMELVADSYRRGFTKDDLRATSKDNRYRPRDSGIDRKAFMVSHSGLYCLSVGVCFNACAVRLRDAAGTPP
jgi:hypothetical protein